MNENKLNILWTNANPVTAKLMVFMYGINAKKKKWWDEVIIILWGATVELAAENERIQNLIKEAQDAGVHITACKGCADELGVTSTLEGFDIEVKYWGEPLTEILKTDGKLLTI